MKYKEKSMTIRSDSQDQMTKILNCYCKLYSLSILK